MPIAKNIVDDYGCPINGSDDCRSAWLDFKTDMQGQDVILTVPAHDYFFDLTAIEGGYNIVEGIANLVVSAYGAAFTGPVAFGSEAIPNNNEHDASIATVAAGSTTVQLLTPAQHTRFSVGQWIGVAGGDLQGSGYPPNPFVFEYAQISGINTGTGVITLSAPLQYSYKQTWPSYATGSAFGINSGGPATIYAMSASWDCSVEWQGLTLTIDADDQLSARARSVKWKDIVVPSVIANGIFPSMSKDTVFEGCNFAGSLMEIDKFIDTVSITSGTVVDLVQCYSSSPNVLTIDNSTIQTIGGSPRKLIVQNGSVIGTQILPGALSYGITREIVLSDSEIATFRKPPGGIVDATAYSISGGVITHAKSNGPIRWAVPGANILFGDYFGGILTEGGTFQVLDVAESGANTLVTTTLTSGYPSFPALTFQAHPCPLLYCSNCTGTDGADLSQAGAQGQPLYSYSKRTYNGSTQSPPTFTLWGTLVSAKINVITPYTGGGALTANIFGEFGAQVFLGGSAVGYSATVNLKVAGERIITPTSETGAQSGDSITIPGAIWFMNTQAPHLSGTGSCSFTIEVITDQGIENLSTYILTATAGSFVFTGAATTTLTKTTNMIVRLTYRKIA